jgi:hypothetical protein
MGIMIEDENTHVYLRLIFTPLLNLLDIVDNVRTINYKRHTGQGH